MKEFDFLMFKAIYESRNISKAAEALHLTQPSLSRSLKKLEDDIGTELFSRSSTGLVPTFAGERYYAATLKILDIFDVLATEISDIDQLQKGRFTIGTTPQLSAQILPSVLPFFEKQYPSVEVITMEMHSKELEKALLEGSIDFALIHMSPQQERNENLNYEIQPVYRDPFLLVASKDHPVVKCATHAPETDYASIALSDFSTERFIGYDPQLRLYNVVEGIFA